MNKKEYNSEIMSRESKIIEQMELLGITDITTDRQARNGTVVWRLPIKDAWSKLCVEVASFKSGYVRNQGVSCHSNYQLNKRCEGEPEYYPITTPIDGDTQYRKFTTRTCELIPKEIDRLEYLIRYCLKNYYIKNANRIANGNYIPKWKYDNLADAARIDYERTDPEVKIQVNGHKYNVSEWFK